MQKALNGVNLQYQQQQYQMKNQYGSSGRSSGNGRNTQKNQNKQKSDEELDTGITTKRMQVAANAAQGQQNRGSDEQTIYNSLRLQGYSEDEIAYAMGTLK